MLPHVDVFPAVLYLSSLFIPSVLAWGNIGHRTVAYLAEKYLDAGATTYVAALLNDQDISDAAVWPDQVRKTPEFKYTAPWHFIDAEDHPPENCTVHFHRDCKPGPGCIVSAITNMTERVNNASLSSKDKGNALKFLLHFIGDIHQPLHTEHEEVGGNTIPVLWHKKPTNLHAAWDSNIIEQYLNWREGDEEQSFAKNWANQLYHAGPPVIGHECHNVQDAEGCALQWAREANFWVCHYVLKDGVDGVKGRNLAEGYYDGAVPIVQDLVGKAGRRLAAWINALAAQEAAMAEENRFRVQAAEEL